MERDKKGRPQNYDKNMLICKLRFEDNMPPAELANMFNTTEDNIFHILYRHKKKYWDKVDQIIKNR